MAITAFSKKFKRELDVKQFQSLYEELPSKLNFADFVKTDIECPCCGVTGGYIVKEGISPITKLAVKQAHFAFKGDKGGNAHLVFCDYYSDEENAKNKTDEAIINLSKSQNKAKATEVVRQLVCSAIDNDIFTQSDIRSMRKWFYEMRSTPDFLVENSKHELNIIRKIFVPNTRTKDEYVVDTSIVNEEWFDLDSEVYQSLAVKLPLSIKNETPLKIKSYFFKKTIVNKAISLSKKNHGLYGFDRSRLEAKYYLAIELSQQLMWGDAFKKRFGYTVHLSHASAVSSNSLMAYSATLLFVNDWNIESSLRMHEAILNSTTDDEKLGNVIGLNPFINYGAWLALKCCANWKEEFKQYDLDKEFLKEKERLKELYQLN